jgi:hypothetical protein
MAKVKNAKISDLIPDDKNANKGTEYGKHLMDKSFRQFGAGRSILLDKNNKIIAGNKSTEQCAEIGIEDVIIVESDGTKLIAVKRTDIDIDTKQGRDLCLADNATQKANLEWDKDIVQSLASTFDIEVKEWGIDIPETIETLEKINLNDAEFETGINKYNDKNCQLPIVKEFFETHECFIIPIHNEIDEKFIREIFCLNENYISDCGDGKIRKTNVIDIQKIKSCLLK